MLVDVTDIIAALSTAGPATLLVVTVLFIAKLWVGAEQRHSSELRRIHELHDAELNELRDNITKLRAAIDELQTALSTERQLRFELEDALHALRLQRET